jgi:hypothetical protein
MCCNGDKHFAGHPKHAGVNCVPGCQVFADARYVAAGFQQDPGGVVRLAGMPCLRVDAEDAALSIVGQQALDDQGTYGMVAHAHHERLVRHERARGIHGEGVLPVVVLVENERELWVRLGKALPQSLCLVAATTTATSDTPADAKASSE